MAIIQAAIERKLSALVGAKVSFAKFNVSFFAGAIEILGVRVGDDDQRPLLTVAKVRAEISIKKAIGGEIVVKSLTIEQPVLTVIRWGDGTSNLPRGTTPAPVKKDEAIEHDKNAWTFDVEKLLLVDGKIGVRLGETYELTVGRLLADLYRSARDYSITLLAEDVQRRDVQANVGTIGMAGTILNAADLTAIPQSALKIEAKVGDIGKARFTTDQIRSRNGLIELEGKLTLGLLMDLLPPRSTT